MSLQPVVVTLAGHGGTEQQEPVVGKPGDGGLAPHGAVGSQQIGKAHTPDVGQT